MAVYILLQPSSAPPNPCTNFARASHSHKWIEKSNGNMARKPASVGENTHLPISDEFRPLLDAIVKFNKKKNKYPKK